MGPWPIIAVLYVKITGVILLRMRKFWKYLVITDYHIAALLLVIAGVFKVNSSDSSEILSLFLENDWVSYQQLKMIIRYQPTVEIILGIYFLIGFKAKLSARLLAATYIFFSALIYWASDGALFESLNCGCFGEEEGTLVYKLLIRNLSIAIPLVFYSKQAAEWSLYRYFSNRISKN